jgi:hypothetical protein
MQLPGRVAECAGSSFLSASGACATTAVTMGAKVLWVFEQVAGSADRFFIRTQVRRSVVR